MVHITFSNFNILISYSASMLENQSNQNLNSNTLNQENSNDKELNSKDANSNWYIEIPSINVKAPIAEGTSKETMDKFVGHFEETSKTFGNIGLAAHNRGYENNYFADLKKLKEGDRILYVYGNFTKEYQIKSHVIIESSNWAYLEDQEQDKNTITLITCVENQPDYRRCVQGEEI